MDELFALVRDCLRAEEPVAWPPSSSSLPKRAAEVRPTALPALGAKLVVRPGSGADRLAGRARPRSCRLP